MRVNRSSFFANRNMRKKGDTAERYEQKLAYHLLKSHLPKHYLIQMEFTPQDLVPFENEATDLSGDRAPKIDIAIIAPLHFKMAIRLNGGAHDRKKPTRYDFVQKTFLEMQPQPWKVVDTIPASQPALFATHDVKPTVEQACDVYSELYSELASLLPLPLYPDTVRVMAVLQQI